MERTRVDLLDVLERTPEAARPLIEARGHRLHLDLAAGPLLIEADPARLTQVLLNLLTNAARYTPEGGNIRLQVTVNPVATEIVIRDDGLGIEPELLPRIFDLFTQGTRGLDRSQGGAGHRPDAGQGNRRAARGVDLRLQRRAGARQYLPGPARPAIGRGDPM